MSHRITIDISDDHYARLVALTKRWVRESDPRVGLKIEAESCFMAGLVESERLIVDAERWCRECGSPTPTHNKGCETV